MDEVGGGLAKSMNTAYIDDIMTFLRIVECGRLSTVAQLQGASVSAVSKSLARLSPVIDGRHSYKN